MISTNFLQDTTLEEGCEGGTAHIIIRKTDGKVMMVWHEK